MSPIPALKFHDGHSIPQLGLGVWQVANEVASTAVQDAIKANYRLIDTAAIYGNEEGVGEGIAKSGLNRDELFITTKIWNTRHGFDETLKAFNESMDRLSLEYLDLLLIHWPVPSTDLYVETWKAFIRLKEEGRVRSIGVSNFTAAHLTRLIDETGVKPVLNQIELHPRLQQREMRAFHEKHGILTESWSPLGSGRLLEDSTLVAIAKKHNKSVAQIILRWHLDKGLIVIPKSITPSRIQENINVFDFKLDADDHDVIDAMDAGTRFGPDPDTFVAP
ncbi:aldo/keto reductase [Microvirga sp. W0021]|uniref:Aldo/keto reductase n=1 Tax=Hohaiivirga grylli TaxID=3133970 RepID=A0ABV0BHY0_9HYPH